MNLLWFLLLWVVMPVLAITGWIVHVVMFLLYVVMLVMALYMCVGSWVLLFKR